MTMSAEQVAGERVAATYGYYRQPNGWITIAVVTELEELKYRREGWTPLPQYGRFDMSTVYAANHPLELLLMRGGAKELSIEQIVESGFHLNPPLVPTCGRAFTQFHRAHSPECMADAKPAQFPQMAGMEVESFQCRFCDRSPFPTDRSRSQHEAVMHREEKNSIRTGSVLADSLVEGMQRAGVSVMTRVGPEREPEDIKEIAALLGKIGLSNKQRKALSEMGVKVPRTRTPKKEASNDGPAA